MDIIIFGASGRTGDRLVRQALLHGHRVTAFVRNSTSVRHVRGANFTVIEGDITNHHHVREAIRGKSAVVSALGVSKTLHHDPKVITGISTIAHAMKEEKINRLIYLSVFLANAERGQFSFFAENVLKRIIRNEVHDHEVKEKIITEHVKAYTIVRATRLTDGRLTRNYRHHDAMSLRNFLPSVSRADVAHFMLNLIEDGTYVNKAVLLTANS